VIDFTQNWISAAYLATTMTEVTDQRYPALDGWTLTLDQGVFNLRKKLRAGGKIIFVGNGGAASTASHLAVDFSLAGLRAIALNDSCALTSHANDFGVEAMFSKQLELLGIDEPDILVAMSCSGKSLNVIRAIQYARGEDMEVVTFSGFEHDNPMRKMGDLNFYTPAHEYGFVQMAHLGILHAAVDIEAGWGP
jgi:D-sedoheptulose 7-phosphate isomerase